jgi:hypothetical protein
MKIFSSIIACLLFCCCFGQEVNFSVCENCWNPDSLGNHRAVVRVSSRSEAVKVIIPWRRRDSNPQDKTIIVHTAAGDQVKNVTRGTINREFGEIFFEPVPGAEEYFIYYLKYDNIGRSNYPTVNYLSFQSSADKGWLKKISGSKSAEVTAIQAIDELNSFFPMEVIATQAEDKTLIEKNRESYLVFPEDRLHPVKIILDLPYSCIAKCLQHYF